MFEKVPQSFDNHGRFVPPFHFVLVPILAINLLWRLYRFGFLLTRGQGRAEAAVQLLLAVGFIILALSARIFALQAQDRVIRLEERLRLQGLLPESLRPRIAEIGRGQLIALRFAPDEEAPGLVSKILAGELKEPKAIKGAIKNWRADYHRV